MQPPFVIVCNHSSHLDTMVLESTLPRRLWDSTFPLAAGDTFFNSPTTALLSAGVINALPMWRDRSSSRHAIQQLRQRLMEDPCGYILFPEGTRTRNGTVGQCKPGIGMLVANLNVPVIPSFLDGAFTAWPHNKKYPRPTRLSLYLGPALDFAGLANDRSGWQAVASQCREAIMALQPS